MTTDATEAIRRASMDLAIGQNNAVLEQIAADLDTMDQRLIGAGFLVRRSDGEMRASAAPGALKVSRAYAGGEHYVSISGVGIARITTALYRRQPTCVHALVEIVLAISANRDFTAYREPGGSLLGLEWGDYLFGERPAPVVPED